MSLSKKIILILNMDYDNRIGWGKEKVNIENYYQLTNVCTIIYHWLFNSLLVIF